MKSLKDIVRLLCVIPVLCVTTGCLPFLNSSSIHRADVTVQLDEPLRDTTSVQVDLVGVTSDDEFLRNFSVDNWFSPPPRTSPDHNTVRADTLKHTMRFSPAGESSGTLAGDDDIWNLWSDRGVRDLMVLVDFLPSAGAAGQREDPRRLIIPLERSRWRGRPDGIVVVVQRSRLDLTTPPNPPKD